MKFVAVLNLNAHFEGLVFKICTEHLAFDPFTRFLREQQLHFIAFLRILRGELDVRCRHRICVPRASTDRPTLFFLGFIHGATTGDLLQLRVLLDLLPALLHHHFHEEIL